MILKLRLKLIRLLIGKLSIVANISTDGNVLVGNGMVVNCLFMDKEIPKPDFPASYCNRVLPLPDTNGIMDYNVIMGERP